MAAGATLAPELKARVALLDIAAARRSPMQQLAELMPSDRIMRVQNLIPVVLARLQSIEIINAPERYEATYERRRRRERSRDYGIVQVYQDLYQIYSGLKTIEELGELTELPLDAEAQAALPVALDLLREFSAALYAQPLPEDLTQVALQQQAAADS